MTYLGGTDPTIPFNVPTFSGGKLRSKSWAVYADAHYSLTDIWSLAGQVRYSQTTKNALERLQIIPFGLDVVDSPSRLKDSGVPIKVGVEGQLTPDILVYGNYSTAFKDGAINLGALQVTPVKKEEVKTFEAGVKSTFLDNKLQVNAAAFSSDYENLQISQLVGTLIQLANAPKAQITGAELEIVARPAAGLDLTANIGYLDPTLEQFSNAPNVPNTLPAPPVQVLDGNQLPYVGEWNVGLGANYRFEPVSGVTAELGGNYYYQSRIYFNEFNVDDNSQKPVGRLDVSASIGPSDESWKLYGYIRNVTDETVLTGTTIYAGLLGAEKGVSYAPPRHFGVGFSYNF